MTKQNALGMLSAMMIALLAGCNDVQYVGRTFDTLPEETAIFFTWEKSEIDPAKYMIVGHGILTVSGDADRYEIEDELSEAARKRGADAVCVTASRRVYEGVYDLDEDELMFPGASTDTALQKEIPVSLENDKKWGKSVQMQGEYHGRKLIKVRAVFWKDRTVAEPLIRRQSELLESKASGNWNGENDPDAPKKMPAPELPPLDHPEKATSAITNAPGSALPPAPVKEATPALQTPADDSPAAPLLEGTNSPERPQFAIPPSDVVAMP